MYVSCGNATALSGSSSTAACTCKPGFFRSSQSTPNCTACPMNSFCTGADAAPTACPSTPPTHYYNYGASSNASCICNAGYFYGNGSTYTCGACPPGSFCPSESQWTTACPGNTTSPPYSTSNQNCTCNAGYKPVSGISGATGVACVACTASEFCASGVIASCLANSYIAPGTSGSKNTDCICAGGWYSSAGPGGACTQCPINAYCPWNSTTFTSCTAYSHSVNQQSSNYCYCNPGYFGNAMIVSPFLDTSLEQPDLTLFVFEKKCGRGKHAHNAPPTPTAS